MIPVADDFVKRFHLEVWRITRRENTHNVFFNGKAALEAKVDEAFAKWSMPNKQL
jgi:hypothetical protein